MHPQFDCVTRETPIFKAAELMRDLDVGMLPVNDNMTAVGTITDRDITIRATAMGLDPNDTMVGEIMTPEIYSCLDDSSIEDAARIMEQHQVRRLLVENSDGQYIGVLALADLARHRETEALGMTVLEEVSQPSMHSRAS